MNIPKKSDPLGAQMDFKDSSAGKLDCNFSPGVTPRVELCVLVFANHTVLLVLPSSRPVWNAIPLVPKLSCVVVGSFSDTSGLVNRTF